jgi:hypothetical protein
VPSTRQLFPQSMNSTSASSVPVLPRSLERSIDYPDASPSDLSPATPPKIRRTTEGPQRISRAATYPSLDEESGFWVSSGKHTNCAPLQPQASGSSLIPNASKPKTHSIPSTPLPSPTPYVSPSRAQTQDALISSETFDEIFDFPDNLPTHVIVHDCNIQAIMDAKRLSRGVQFEIARGISQGKWHWPDVTPERLHLLEGSNADSAWKVTHVMQSRELPSVPQGNFNLW